MIGRSDVDEPIRRSAPLVAAALASCRRRCRIAAQTPTVSGKSLANSVAWRQSLTRPCPRGSCRWPSDLDVHRSAHLWIQTHGENGTATAREMVEAMRKKGDERGADA